MDVDVKSYDRPAEPAMRQWTARVMVPGPYTLGTMEEVLESLRRAGVPSSAQVQMGYPEAFAHWSKVIEDDR